MHTRWRRLTLVKGRHRYVFRYPAGQEGRLLAELIAQAQDPDGALDWSDVLAIAFRIGNEFLEAIDPNNTVTESPRS